MCFVDGKRICPFDGKRCSSPDAEWFSYADFCGCRVYGGRGHGLACPRFPEDISITACRDVWSKFYEEHERKRRRRKAKQLEITDFVFYTSDIVKI